jgi:cytochrome c oxidase subunit II
VCMNLLLAYAKEPAENLSIFNPVSPQAQAISNLSILVFAISAFIFIVVEGILFYSIFRFRQRGAATPNEPPQVYGSVPIEIAWTAAPTVVVFITILVTTRALWEVDASPPEPKADDNTLFVTVVGRQWWWEFQDDSYNGRKLGFTTANEFHFPTGEAGTTRPVYLTLKSADVCHSFWVPRLAGKTDLIPNHINSMWFDTSQAGVYLGQCAEYCGTQHAKMLLSATAESPEDFERWLASEQRPAVDDAAVAEGKQAFLSLSCVNCHRIRGTIADGTFGPDLTHLMSRQTLASGAITNTPENLRAWVTDPQTIKPGCLMPAFGLTQNQLDLVVRYLSTLK